MQKFLSICLLILAFSITSLAQWMQTSAPITNVNGFVSHGTKMFILDPDFGIYMSTDDGETWIPRNHDLFFTGYQSIYINQDTLFLAGFNLAKMHVNDTAWTMLSSHAQSCLLVTNPYYISGYQLSPIFFKSSDYGVTWNTVTINNAPGGGAFKTIIKTGDALLAGHSWGIYRSTNDGEVWDTVKGGFPSPQTNAFHIHPTGIYAAGFMGFDPMLLRSTNNGSSWVNVSPTGFLSGTIASLTSSASAFYCTVPGRGVYFSTDNGSNWTQSNTGITTPSTSNYFFVHGSNAFVSANGLWKRPLSQITSTDDDDLANQPSNFYLAQNYPNPFNPSTKISWQVPFSSHQTLKVYDVLGKEVATLVDEEKPAGNYEIEFDAANLSSGMYLYRLQAGSFIETKKMIYLK